MKKVSNFNQTFQVGEPPDYLQITANQLSVFVKLLFYEYLPDVCFYRTIDQTLHSYTEQTDHFSPRHNLLTKYFS